MNYDIVIRDAEIIDGLGNEPIWGDLALQGDRIVKVGGSISGHGRHEIAAHGTVVAPGFIDVHTHDDRLVLSDPSMNPKLSQGVTTVVTGNCGISLAPMQSDGLVVPPLTLLGGAEQFQFKTFQSYLDEIRRAGIAVNVVPFVGHTSLRVTTMLKLNREATENELDEMASSLDEAMKSGAFGLSTGLYYPPAHSATADEVGSLLRVVARYGGLTTSHLRDEGDNLVSSIDEALKAARLADVPIVISHLKCAGPAVWGKSGEILKMLEAAAAIQQIAFDVYPYDASSTMLRPEVIGDSRKVIVSWSAPHPEKAGQDLADIATCWCCSPTQAARRLSPGGAIYYKMQERDVRKIVSHPLSMIGSDGLPHDAHPHPRLWGTFPRVLGRYVRELKLLTLPQAVRKMTSMPAFVFGLKDRGSIVEGAFADLTMFDQSKVIDEATYDRPRRPSMGVSAVIVNGVPAWSNGATALGKSGRILQRSVQ